MICIIGDIHGCIQTFDNLMNRVLKEYIIEKIIYVGDFIDRGYGSKEVINLAIEISKSYDTVILLGNHEDMMLDYVYNENRYDDGVWFYNGGLDTIRSFSENLYNLAYFQQDDIRYELRLICEGELNFLRKSKLFYEIPIRGEIFFVSHAGIEFPEVSPYNQLDAVKNEFDRKIKHPYIWARNVDNFTKKIDNFVFVHGHTPVQYLGGSYNNPIVNRDREGRLISVNIDTGCVYGGYLTGMLLNDNGEFEFILERYRG